MRSSNVTHEMRGARWKRREHRAAKQRVRMRDWGGMRCAAERSACFSRLCSNQMTVIQIYSIIKMGNAIGGSSSALLTERN
jgi:hypothetical protein